MFKNTHIQHFIFGLIMLLIIVLNTEPGSILMGLDNISPYFSFEKNIKNIFFSPNFFLHGPEIFNLPVQLMVWLGIPASTVSWVDYWLTFMIGMFGWYFLIRHIVKKVRVSRYAPLILSIVVLSSLSVVFVFSQPNMIFRAIFASTPLLVYFLIDSKKTHLRSVSLFLGLMYLYLSSLNIVLFVLMFIQIFVISVILSYLLKKDMHIRRISKYLFAIFCMWLLFSQVILLTSSTYSKTIATETYYHLTSFIDNEQMGLVTNDLTTSEMTNNTFLSVSRYKTGWIELHDSKGPVFREYEQFNADPLIVFAGLIPLFIVIVGSPKAVLKKKRILLLVLAYFAVILIQTRVGITLRSYIPLIGDGTRWLSSKIWPLQLMLEVVLLIYALKYIGRKWNGLLLSVLLVSSLISILTVYNGKLLSRHLPARIPEEYSMLTKIPEDETIMVTPPPQFLYFREYDWGYYGSDFYRYMIKANTFDVSSINSGYERYHEIYNNMANCDTSDLDGSLIDYVLVDRSVQTENPYICEPVLEAVEENIHFTLYKVD